MANRQQIDLKTLRKQAKRSWNGEFEGLKLLSSTSIPTKEAFPYVCLKEQIERSEILIDKFEDDKYRLGIVKQQALEAKLLFLLRYRWQYEEKGIYPFKDSWIYRMQREIISDKYIAKYFNRLEDLEESSLFL